MKLKNSRKTYNLKKTLRLVSRLAKMYTAHPLEFEFADFQFKQILKNIQERLVDIILLLDAYKIQDDYDKFLTIIAKQIKTLCKSCIAICKCEKSMLPIQMHIQLWSTNQIHLLFISYELEHIKFNEVTSKCAVRDKKALQFWFKHFGTE